jgi:3,4-dihydroxy 2-butanone 4-phosphate synthase/GTP cyclohydrolase II
MVKHVEPTSTSCYGALLNRLDDRLAATTQRSRPDRPFVTVSYAQSLDGSISNEPGKTLRLSNLQSQTLTHHIRARHDGILVGINTILVDDPRLTVRLVDGEDPVPVILDSFLRLPVNARVVRERRGRPVIVATAADACTKKEADLRDVGIQIVRLPVSSDGLIDLPALLRRLRLEGITSLMVEGGGRTITSFLAGHLADQLIMTICPVLVGGVHALNPCLTARATMPFLTNVDYFSLDGDTVVTAEVVNDPPGPGTENSSEVLERV